jgi:hypothetical protein
MKLNSNAFIREFPDKFAPSDILYTVEREIQEPSTSRGPGSSEGVHCHVFSLFNNRLPHYNARSILRDYSLGHSIGLKFADEGLYCHSKKRGCHVVYCMVRHGCLSNIELMRDEKETARASH